MRYRFLGIFAALVVSCSAFADFDRGEAAYLSGDYATAYREFRKSADYGHAPSQFKLGVLFGQGRGVEKDDAVAHGYFKESAESGHVEAMGKLALTYVAGRGVEQDNGLAVHWSRKAAEHGDPLGQTLLGYSYRYGKGNKQDDAVAFKWYRLAALKGQRIAQGELGRMYENGITVPRNFQDAVQWYRLSAMQGHAVAQFNLGRMYALGRGISVDLVQAYKWVSLAAAQGFDPARVRLDAYERRMKAVEISEAQNLAANFKERREERGTQNVTSPSSGEPKPSPTPPSRAELVDAKTVQKIQRYLNALGYDPGPIDGVVGQQTILAIRQFQFEAGIEPDGAASTTLEALLAIVVAEAEPEPSPAPTIPTKPGEIQLVSSGSGFFITDHGHLLTNHHVIDDCQKLRVALPQGSSNTRLIAAHKEDDLAILQADVRPSVVAHFRRSVAELGEDISVAGYPLHGLLSGMNLTTGSVSSTSGLGGDPRYLQITAPVQSGNSGGPLLDTAGSVVGVIVAKLDVAAVALAMGDMPQNVNFAIKNDVARTFLREHGIGFQETDREPNRNRTAVAAEAQQHTVLVECWK